MEIHAVQADPRDEDQLRTHVQYTSMVFNWLSVMFADWTLGDSFGTLSTQDADAVAITGGAVDGTVVGGTTAAAGTFTDLKATTKFGLVVAPVAQQDHVADAPVNAVESHAITDPGDAPADADALRDDLVANVIPSIEAALNALGVKCNAVGVQVNLELANSEAYGLNKTS